MNILKKILTGLAVLVAILLILAIFIPKDYTVSVSTVINKPTKMVFDYVSLIKNQEKYSVWVLADPKIKIDYKGTDGRQGFTSSWYSEDDNVGVGSQKITKISCDTKDDTATEGNVPKINSGRIDVDLHFVKPFAGDEKAATIVTEDSFGSMQNTKVTSEFYGHNDYPLNLFSFIGKKFIKDAQTSNLKNLKKILEK